MTRVPQKPLHVVLVHEHELDDVFIKYRTDFAQRLMSMVPDWPRRLLSSSKEMWMFISPSDAHRLRGYKITSFCQWGKVYEHEKFTDIIQILIRQSL